MKQTIKSLMMGAMMMALPFLFTSCEDILGHWEKPTPATPTVEEMLTNLSSALEEGALVTITYTVDGVTYTSTFKKVGDEYVEQSTTSASRALTRASSNILAQLHEYQKTLNFQVIKNKKVVLNAEINSNDGAYITTFSSDGAELKGVAVNDASASLTNVCNKSITIRPKGGGEGYASVHYKDGDTWKDFCERQSPNGHMVILILGNKVFLSNDNTWQLYKDAGCTDPVSPDDKITQDVYLKVEPITYQEASWDETNHKVVYKNPAPSTYQYTLVSLSGSRVEWAAGTYVVKSNITINGYLKLNGDVNLILCDGATLTVNGTISGNDAFSLTIYGQSKDDDAGKLEVNDGLDNLNYLTIHGGNIKVERQFFGICNTPLTVYGGKLSITSEDYAIYDYAHNDMTVYGGEFNAISNRLVGILLGDVDGYGTLTVYGGKVTAQGGDGNRAIFGYFKAGEGTSVNFFGRAGTNDGWEGITETPTTATTSDYRYFYAGVNRPSN